MQIGDGEMDGHCVLSNKDVADLHNLLVETWCEAGFASDQLRDQDLRGRFILSFARSIEAAVIERLAPERVGVH